MLQRLLSDPFSLPIQFKTWLVAYLETSDLTLPMSAILGLRSTLGISGAGQGTLGIFPAGLILPYGADTAPEGALLCNGAAYSTTAENRLFVAIGYRWGGSGSAFNVPDFRERLLVGKGSLAAHDTIGKTENMPLGQRGTAHKHPHSHPIQMNQDGSTSGSYVVVGTDHAADGNGTTLPVDAGPSASPTNTPAFGTVNFIIVK